MNDLIGVVLNKHYRIERFLGSGGMAEVYEARDVDAPHYYAIKVIREQLLEHPELVRRFEAEAQRLKDLQHPNIVRFYDFVTSDGLTYIVMEYIEGYSLSRLLRLRRQRDEGPLPVEESVRILAQVSRALARVHEQGLVHRDVKPGNILIRKSDGAAFLTDLGVAKDLAASAVTQTVIGTLAYLAPEQILRQPVSPATDIYALGTVAYLLFTARRPFEASTDDGLGTSQMEQALIEQHLRQLPRPASSLNPRLPPALDTALSRALAKPPDARYPDATGFMHAVHDALRPLLPADMQILSHIDALPTPARRLDNNKGLKPLVLRLVLPFVLKLLAPIRGRLRWAALAVIVVAAVVLLVLTRGISPPVPPILTATPSPPPNLTTTADWLTVEAQRLALQSTGTRLAQALASPSPPPPTEIASATPTSPPTATPSATILPTVTATPSATILPTATATASHTPSITPTTTLTPTDTPTPNQRATLRAEQRALRATGTQLALTLSAPSPTPPPSVTPGPAALSPAPSALPEADTSTPAPSLTATPNQAATQARATMSALRATGTRLAHTLNAPSPTATATLTPTSAEVAAYLAISAWCRQADLLRDAFGFDDAGASDNQANEEALLQYLVERESAPLNPATGQPPRCMANIDAWLYPRLLEAAQTDFATAYSRPPNAGIAYVDRAQRYLDYATAIHPADPDAATLSQCVNVLSLVGDPSAARDAIAQLRAQAADLSICEPALSQMWESAVTPTPSSPPVAAVSQTAYLYELPGRTQTGILGAGVPVLILAQTDEIEGAYWFFVELEDGRRGYLRRRVLDWEGGLESVPVIDLTPVQ